MIVNNANIEMLNQSGPLDSHGHYPDGAIVVEADHNPETYSPGGRLYVKNNSTITGNFTTAATYDGFPGWLGIFVEGLPPSIWGQAMSSSFHKAVATLQNSTIKCSTFGVANFNYQNETGLNGSFTNSKNSNGGTIVATNVTFLDNVTAVTMMNYESYPTYLRDNSTFTLCTFNNYSLSLYQAAGFTNPGPGFYSPVYLQNIIGPKFLGCTFNYDVLNSLAKYAINANSAGFTVDQFCPTSTVYNLFNTCSGTPTHTAFTGGYAKAAINVENSGTYNPVSIQNSTFSQLNGYYITLDGCRSPLIASNTFNLNPIHSSGYPNCVALGLNHCSGYTVQSNTVTGSTSTHPLFGITIANSGPSYNLVNNNTCSSLNYSLQAIGDNKNTYSDYRATGLNLNCNLLSSNTLSTAIDMSIVLASGTSATTTSGIAISQGSSNIAAGNTFASTSTWSIDNTLSSSPLSYYYGTGIYQHPVSVTGASIAHAALNRTCPSNIGTLVWNIAEPRIFPLLGGGGALPGAEPMMTTVGNLIDSAMYQQLYADTMYVHLDTVETILDTLNYSYLYDYKVQLAGLMVQEYRFDDALHLLTALPTADTLDSMATVKVNNLVRAYGVCYDLYKVNNHWDSLSTTDINIVYNIDSTDFSYAQAVTHRLLHQYVADVFYPSLAVPITTGERPAPSTVSNIQQMKIAIYPNPVTDDVYINTYNNTGIGMQLTDISGRTLAVVTLQAGVNTVDMRQYAPGIYIAKLYNNGQLLQTEKIARY
ncbi:MAG: T9SS type A sorting domain-containing protein [Flavipsychrobacter sp.]|nr:T9SS type A sorting domain-containing protein [Flavipsychrobacter sp.]